VFALFFVLLAARVVRDSVVAGGAHGCPPSPRLRRVPPKRFARRRKALRYMPVIQM
jgi:hypothetical protein